MLIDNLVIPVQGPRRRGSRRTVDEEEFAVVMYLIRGKLAGRQIPDTLPPSLVPPASLPSAPMEEEAGPSACVPNITVDGTEEQTSQEPPPPYEEPDVNNVPDQTRETT